MSNVVASASSIIEKRRNRIPVASGVFPLLILLLYLALSLPYLDRAPLVHQDEPWIASTGWKLATRGIYGSDVFAGYFHMEDRYYLNLPLYAFLTAPLYKVIGVGLWQVRWATIAMGTIVLALTYTLGRRFYGARVGLLAMVLLLFTGHAGLSAYRLTGILLTDSSRVARYDILVPIFLLLVLYQFDRARYMQNRQNWHYAATGFWVACATLSNLYGIFAVGVFGILLLWQRARWQSFAAFGTGVALPLLIPLLYILDDPASFRGQVHTHSPRFGITQWAWYWNNWQHEELRYAMGTTERWWSRPGALLSFIGVPLALSAVALQALRGIGPARLVLVPSLLIPLAFGWLISVKRVEYLMIILPVWAIALAWGWIRLWDGSKTVYTPRMSTVVNGILTLLLGVLLLDGTLRYERFYRRASTLPPYNAFTTAIRTTILPDRRVIGLHSYWFSFTDTDYRTWYTFLNLAGSEYTPFVRSLPDSLTLFNPDYIMIDPNTRDYFTAPGSGDQRREELEAWMAAHQFRLLTRVEDTVYGQFDIYGQ